MKTTQTVRVTLSKRERAQLIKEAVEAFDLRLAIELRKATRALKRR